MPQPMRCYLEYARFGFVNILAFRLRYYTGIVTYVINVTVYYFIWKALYGVDPEFARGFSFPEMVTYVAVGWVIRSVYFNNIDQNIATDVQNGSIEMAFLKPTSAQVMYLGPRHRRGGVSAVFADHALLRSSSRFCFRSRGRPARCTWRRSSSP